jgi:class 3 adenylate cyclase
MTWGEGFVSCFEYLTELISGQPTPASDRVLATVMFEDVVSSTPLVSEIGDEAWRDLMVQRNRIVCDAVERCGGRIVQTSGDGSMSMLPGPAAAVRCAERLHEDSLSLGVRLRVGIHTGECERVGNDLAGLAVHIAARISAAAAPGETLVSRPVADLVAGSALCFESQGARRLKGVPGTWELLAAQTIAPQPNEPAAPPNPRLTDRAVIQAARRAPRLVHALARLDDALARRRANRASATP